MPQKTKSTACHVEPVGYAQDKLRENISHLPKVEILGGVYHEKIEGPHNDIAAQSSVIVSPAALIASTIN